MIALMERAGLREIAVSDGVPFWHGLGVKPSTPV
jgi:hypothetical protein